MDDNISIEKLIEEGKSLLSTLTKDPSVPGFVGYPTYSFNNYDNYTVWKHTCIRYVFKYFPNDISSESLKVLFQQFDHHQRPSVFKQILGVLQSLKEIPEKIVVGKVSSDNNTIQIINSNSQSQEQSTNLNIIIQSISEELTGRQLKELKEIIQSDQDVETKKKSIKEKFISFGRDLAPSILANIITNPQIWGALF